MLSLYVSKLPCGKKMQRDSGCKDCDSYETCVHWESIPSGSVFLISDLRGLNENPVDTLLEMLHIELAHYDKELVKNKQLFGVESKHAAGCAGTKGYIQYLIQLINNVRVVKTYTPEEWLKETRGK